jgi:ribosome biogenesis GTPase
VGKSSILNCIEPGFSIATGQVSDKLGRGRHTTRHTELYRLPGGALVADTPGFSSFDIEKMELMTPQELQYAFVEFRPYIGSCRYTGCAHIKERGCAVREAVLAGEIPESRHASYARLYGLIKSIPEWEQKKKDG